MTTSNTPDPAPAIDAPLIPTPEEKSLEQAPSSPCPSITESITKSSFSVALPIQEKVSDIEPSTTTNPTQPTQPTPNEDYDPCIGAKPYSPFYRHATPSSKLSRLASQKKRSRSIGTSPIDEVETGGGHHPPWHRLYDDEAQNYNNQHESKLKLWAQEKRYCYCMQGLSRGQRMLVKAAIAVVVLGSMVAVALGITAAVGGGVWRPDHQVERFPE